MQWSQLKKRIEATFADTVKGRVEVFCTRYRHAHDGAGESWVTIDGKQIRKMGTLQYRLAKGTMALQLTKARDGLDYTNPDQNSGYRHAHAEAEQATHDRGIFSAYEFNGALFDYLNLSIDDALASDNPIIRAFALLDRRFGKRRLLEFVPTGQRPFIQRLYDFRRVAEGLAPVIGVSE
jgi:hypothetical protein